DVEALHGLVAPLHSVDAGWTARLQVRTCRHPLSTARRPARHALALRGSRQAGACRSRKSGEACRKGSGAKRHEGRRMSAVCVVVGAGSAGCVVASRLSETGGSGILREAGPADWHPMIHVPAGMRSLIRHPVVNWNYTTEPEKGSGERRLEWPRGRVLGGS